MSVPLRNQHHKLHIGLFEPQQLSCPYGNKKKQTMMKMFILALHIKIDSELTAVHKIM